MKSDCFIAFFTTEITELKICRSVPFCDWQEFQCVKRSVQFFFLNLNSYLHICETSILFFAYLLTIFINIYILYMM